MTQSRSKNESKNKDSETTSGNTLNAASARLFQMPPEDPRLTAAREKQSAYITQISQLIKDGKLDPCSGVVPRLSFFLDETSSTILHELADGIASVKRQS